MDKRINWAKITPTTAVWCETEEEAREFIASAMEKYPTEYAVFASGEISWEHYKTETCYATGGLKGLPMLSPRGFFESIGYTVLPFAELLADKPRICEVLGVEVGEMWSVTGRDRAQYHIEADGNLEYRMPKYSGIGYGGWISNDVSVDFINHPDRIIRQPRFTEDEVADAKAIIHLIDGSTTGVLQRADTGALRLKMGDTKVRLDCTLFPSILPGQCVELADVVRQKENRPG